MPADRTRHELTEGRETRASDIPQTDATHADGPGRTIAVATINEDIHTRYELLDEIAHGGMGVVLRATDRTLGREVAIKVLLDRYSADSIVARRFLDEARITGQFQHPGIPPVQDIDSLPDGRPFLSMKLIKGHTLKAQLKKRPDSAADRGRFLAIFEAICQAVAYAARSIIHRDLKPANVMVGAFGEVQVMDWGLAKVLCTGARDRPVDTDDALATEIRSDRDSDGTETQAGSVMGTPAYMAPDQAIGAINQVDERSDVFGLGAILAVILSGEPPFIGDTAEGTPQKSARGKVEECFDRLESSGAEPELVALCKRCLSPEREDRPANGAAVAALDSPPDPDASRVRAAADLVDTDPVRKEIRAAAAGGDNQKMVKLAERVERTDITAATAVMLGSALYFKGSHAETARFLRAQRDRHPSDLQLLWVLCRALKDCSHDNPVLFEEAVGCARAAVAAHPESAFAYYALGQLFDFDQKDRVSAERYYRTTLELNPRFTHCMINLANLVGEKGDLAENEALVRRAVATDPRFVTALNNLGMLLAAKGDVAGAESELRRAIDLDPKRSLVHRSLGIILRSKGDLAGAEAEFQTAVDLDPESKDAYAREQLSGMKRIRSLMPRLESVLAGQASSTSALELVEFAQVLNVIHRYAAAVDLFLRAFAGDPKLAEILDAFHRYNAACSAALAADGQGADPPADSARRAALRCQALDWLRADFAAWSKLALSDKAADRARAAANLSWRLRDPDMLSVRPGSHRKIPEAEQPAWETFWADLRATLARAQTPINVDKPPTKP